MKNIIITGASRGIGFELTKLFAAKYKVFAISRNSKPINALEHKNITTISADLSKEDSYQKIIKIVSKHCSHIDILIHNAGTLINKPLSKTTFQDFKKVYNVNVFAVAELTRVLLPYLHKGSHVVTISSIGGIQGSVKFPGLAAYSSSKGAVITLSELLAEEYKEQGIAFNVLALGAVQTEMLAEAFPDYKAPTTAKEMASYIFDFALTGNHLFNGKIIQVSNSTP